MTRSEFKKQLQEMSTSAGAGGYTGKYAYNPNSNAKGAARNYYLKMGWKLVNREKLRKKTKGLIVKDLWSKK
jgi:hypothetical protein